MSFVKRVFEPIHRFVDRPWFVPLVALFAAADLFIYCVPTEVLLVAAVVAKRSRWLSGFLLVTTGSALGAVVLAAIVRWDSPLIVTHLFPGIFQSKAWTDTAAFFDSHGSLALGLMALGPLPQQPAVIMAGFTKLNLLWVFVSVWIGRGIKYGFFAWCAAFAPRFVEKKRAPR